MAAIRFNAPGDDKDVVRTVTSVPSGQVIDKAWLTIKNDEADPDPGVLQKTITTTGGPSGVIDQLNNKVTFLLQPADTRLIGTAFPGPPKFYDIQVLTDLLQVYTGEFGTIGGKYPEITVTDS